MKCRNPECREPHKGARYVVDSVEVCLSCAEMTRAGKLVTLDDFIHLRPDWQRMIGDVRTMVQEATGQYDRYKDDGAQVVRS